MKYKKTFNGCKFTTRFWLQGKIRAFIKDLDYDIEKVSGFIILEQKSKDELIEWKKTLLKNLKNKLAACYEEVVDDMASEDTAIFKLQINTDKIEDANAA